MERPVDLTAMEREAYRAYWSDGIVDIYLGISLSFMGVMWTWVDGFAGLAGIVPAILVTPMLAGHRRFVEARLGHVEWRPDRRSWEHRNQLLLLAAGVLALGLALVLFRLIAADDSLAARSAPGLMSWLLALLALGLAFLLDARRMALYAVVLVSGGIVVVLLEAGPGWPMLACGVVASVVGLVMLRRFVERHPVIDQA